MNKWARNSFILCAPFLLMVAVNEYFRIKQHIPLSANVKLNTEKHIADQCTWACHDDTIYCINHHVKISHEMRSLVDPFYFGMIGFLGSTGNYEWANILLLAIVWPICMFILFLQVIDHRNLK